MLRGSDRVSGTKVNLESSVFSYLKAHVQSFASCLATVKSLPMPFSSEFKNQISKFYSKYLFLTTFGHTTEVIEIFTRSVRP